MINIFIRMNAGGAGRSCKFSGLLLQGTFVLAHDPERRIVYVAIGGSEDLRLEKYLGLATGGVPSSARNSLIYEEVKVHPSIHQWLQMVHFLQLSYQGP